MESGGYCGCKDEYALFCGFSAPNPQFNRRLDFLVNNGIIEKIEYTEENFEKYKNMIADYSKEKHKLKNIYIIKDDWMNILLGCDLSARGNKKVSKNSDDRKAWIERRNRNRKLKLEERKVHCREKGE